MASTISNPQVGTFKRIKMQYVVAAAGVALAAAAIAGGLTLRNDIAAPAPSSVTHITDSRESVASYPLVQEMSHPQIALLVSGTSDVAAGGFPLIQEVSHPIVPAASATVSDVQTGSFPEVQELSHPVITAPVPTDSTPDNGSYPMVQEISHPR
jgi:hypothetical protein